MARKNEVDEVWKSAPVLCELKKSTTPRISKVPCDEATALVTKAFDVPFDGVSTVYPFVIPQEILNLDVNIIQIVGPSGSGKSTFLKAFEKAGWHFPNKTYDNSKAVVSNYADDPKAGIRKLGAVGLGSKKTYVRPRNVLSTGEGFRADLALNLESKVMIDEYTSVVNRECAMSASHSVQKYIRKNNLKHIIFCGCHYDIIPMLKPDILVDLNTEKVYDLRGFRLGKASTSPSSESTSRSGSERSGKYSLRITI